MKEKTIGLLELQAEKAKLEADRAVLGERIQALTAEREKTQQQLIMTAAALQTIDHFIGKTGVEDEKSEPKDLLLEEHGPGPDEEK